MTHKRVFLCHRCHVASESTGLPGYCDGCGRVLSHYVTWASPDEDAAARLLIRRELVLAQGGWGADDRTRAAIKDSSLSALNLMSEARQ